MHRWDTPVMHYYTRPAPADGQADVKLDRIRRSVPPTVKRTLTSERWLQGRQAQEELLLASPSFFVALV